MSAPFGNGRDTAWCESLSPIAGSDSFPHPVADEAPDASDSASTGNKTTARSIAAGPRREFVRRPHNQPLSERSKHVPPVE